MDNEDAVTTTSKPRSPAPFWWPDAQGFTIGAIIIICAACLFYRMTHASTTDDKVLDMMLTIMFGTALVAIINYLFGSSRSSAAKDDTLNRIALEPTPPTPPVVAVPVAPTPSPSQTPAPAPQTSTGTGQPQG